MCDRCAGGLSLRTTSGRHKIRLLPKFKHCVYCEEVAAGDDQTRAGKMVVMGVGNGVGRANWFGFLLLAFLKSNTFVSSRRTVRIADL